MCHLSSLASFKVYGVATSGMQWRQWGTCSEAALLQRTTVALPVKKYVNTYGWCLLCKHAYLTNTKTVNLIFFFLLKNEHIGPFMADMWVFFPCWPKQPPVIATEGTAPVTHHTRAHTHKCGCIIFGRGCVYSVSVLIIRYLVRGFFLCA